MNDFKNEVIERISAISNDKQLCEAAAAFMHASIASKYSYRFFWQGRPIIQHPQVMGTGRQPENGCLGIP